jgi:hypothetical protein
VVSYYIWIALMKLVAGRQAVKYSQTDISGLRWEYNHWATQ